MGELTGMTVPVGGAADGQIGTVTPNCNLHEAGTVRRRGFTTVRRRGHARE
jgi:hypothetical protein